MKSGAPSNQRLHSLGDRHVVAPTGEHRELGPRGFAMEIQAEIAAGLRALAAGGGGAGPLGRPDQVGPGHGAGRPVARRPPQARGGWANLLKSLNIG